MRLVAKLSWQGMDDNGSGWEDRCLESGPSCRLHASNHWPVPFVPDIRVTTGQVWRRSGGCFAGAHGSVCPLQLWLAVCGSIMSQLNEISWEASIWTGRSV